LTCDNGQAHFLKWNDQAAVEMFAAEADGLEALRAAETLRVPEVLGWGGSGTPSDPGWLLMEFIPNGPSGKDYGRKLGEGLAGLHGAVESGPHGGEFGWHRSNFIGSLPQENQERAGWCEFWRDLRIEPQVSMARGRGYFSGGEGRILDDLMDRMDELLPEDEHAVPSLLHGDLWSGNFYADTNGDPVIIDPAVYRGAGMVDLAMMELFGSLPRGFREAYGGNRHLPGEYDAYLRDLYQLYYLLVHVNLFGGGYVGGSIGAARRVLAAF
jgi:fructosamine-3-kinase